MHNHKIADLQADDSKHTPMGFVVCCMHSTAYCCTTAWPHHCGLACTDALVLPGSCHVTF
jgi:hypothetical protein